MERQVRCSSGDPFSAGIKEIVLLDACTCLCRFRPNFVVDGFPAYDEDHWTLLQVCWHLLISPSGVLLYTHSRVMCVCFPSISYASNASDLCCTRRLKMFAGWEQLL